MVIKYHTTTDNMHHDPIESAAQIASKSTAQPPVWLSDSPTTASNHPIPSTTQRATDIYLLSQRPNGEMGGIGWWQSANGYTAMALHDLWSNTKHNYSILDTAIRQCEARHRGLINVFNDDTLWWAQLCCHMFELGGDPWYLDVARGIWQHIQRTGNVCGKGKVFFKGEDMEGAVYWRSKKDEECINSISTSLFAELSVRLALTKMKSPDHPACASDRTSCETYLDSARCSLAWILRHRYRPREGVVLDHIKLKQEKCVDWTFTYNTGVVLGVCALLYAATRESEYMALACHIARKAMAHKGWVEPNGVLTEKGVYGRGTHDPWKDNDSVGFKAVLVRHLAVLYDVVSSTGCEQGRETAEQIERFLEINFQAQVERNTNGKGQYGPWWNGPFENPTSHSQMAVLDVMAAIRAVER